MTYPPSLDDILLRPVWERFVVLGCLPLLDVREELGLTGDVLPQHLWDRETFGRLVVFEKTAESSLSCTYYTVLVYILHSCK